MRLRRGRGPAALGGCLQWNAGDQSAEMPAALMAGPHFAISRSTSICKYSLERRSAPTSVVPSSCMRSWTALLSIASLAARLSFDTIAAGVPFGRKRPLEGLLGDQSNRREVGSRVIRQLLIERRIVGMRPDCAEKH